MSESQNVNVQPAPDIPASGLMSLSLGLLVGDGLLLFSGIGAILGHELLDNAFGWQQDLLIGAVSGAVIGTVGALEIVKTMSARLLRKEV